MNTYASLTDALAAGRQKHAENVPPRGMIVNNEDGNYSVQFGDLNSVAVVSAGDVGFWHDQASRAFIDNQYANNIVIGMMMARSGRLAL